MRTMIRVRPMTLPLYRARSSHEVLVPWDFADLCRGEFDLEDPELPERMALLVALYELHRLPERLVLHKGGRSTVVVPFAGAIVPLKRVRRLAVKILGPERGGRFLAQVEEFRFALERDAEA